MPTINPRINVTLSPSLYGMVGELAKYQRVSRSMVLRELLEASEPALAVSSEFGELAQLSRQRGLERDREAWVFCGHGAS